MSMSPALERFLFRLVRAKKKVLLTSRFSDPIFCFLNNVLAKAGDCHIHENKVYQFNSI